MLWLWLFLGVLGCWGQRSLLVQSTGCSSNVTSACGQLCYAGSNGTITLPTNCGGQYCDNMNCTYQVCPPPGTRQLFLAFPVVDLECGLLLFDYLKIQDRKFCNVPEKSLIFPTVDDGCLNVQFISDAFNSRSGFTMKFSTKLICPTVFTSSAGNVSLPTECDGHYCPNMNCYIGICPDSQSGYVTLTFSLFHVDDNETCSRDVLEIDGTAYCSLDSVPRVFPMDQRGCLNLTFRSDNSHQGLGFRLSYKAGVVASCPMIYMGPRGVVAPPVPPPAVALNCTVEVCLGPKASHVSLTARQWDLSCPDNYLEAGERRYCQASPQGEVLALDGRGCLDLLFHWSSSMSRVQLLYFLYNPECGVGDLVSDSGLLSVPTTCQGRYCDNLDCSYHMCPLSPSRSLAFSLLVMDMVDSSCTGDYLTIGTSQQKYCSLVNVPRVDVDRWGCVSAGFHSDGHGGGHGFLLSFSTFSQACGVLAYLTDHGSITLPADCGGKYCPNLNCTYTVCPQSRSTHVQITQRMFHTVSTNCASDFLQINQTRICEFDPRPKLYPVDSKGCLSMTFRSDQDSNGFGFRLDYIAQSLAVDVTVTPWKQTTTASVDVPGNIWSKRDVVIVVSSLSAIVLVVIIVLVVVSVHLHRAKRRSHSSSPCSVHFEPNSRSEPVWAQGVDSGYITPIHVAAEVNDYEVLEDV